MVDKRDVDVLHYQLRSKALDGDVKELYELSLLAGMKIDPHIFKILMDLLKLNVSPVALASTLRSICASQRSDAPVPESFHSGQHNRTTSSDSSGGHSTSIPSSSASHVKRSRSNIAMRSHHSTSDIKDHSRPSRRSRLSHH